MKNGLFYGYIEPIQATSDMTMDVGQRLGKLYTYDETTILPTVTEDDDYAVLMILNKTWIKSKYMFENISALLIATTLLRNKYNTAKTIISDCHNIIGGNTNV